MHDPAHAGPESPESSFTPSCPRPTALGAPAGRLTTRTVPRPRPSTRQRARTLMCLSPGHRSSPVGMAHDFHGA